MAAPRGPRRAEHCQCHNLNSRQPCQCLAWPQAGLGCRDSFPSTLVTETNIRLRFILVHNRLVTSSSGCQAVISSARPAIATGCQCHGASLPALPGLFRCDDWHTGSLSGQQRLSVTVTVASLDSGCTTQARPIDSENLTLRLRVVCGHWLLSPHQRHWVRGMVLDHWKLRLGSRSSWWSLLHPGQRGRNEDGKPDNFMKGSPKADSDGPTSTNLKCRQGRWTCTWNSQNT